MPQTSDARVLRPILEADRAWAVYALGDLDPRRFPQCEWHYQDAPPAVLLLYRLPGKPVLLTVGEPEAVAALLDEAGPPAEVDLHIRPDVVPEIRRRYRTVQVRPLLRMVLSRPSLAAPDLAARLTAVDVPEIVRLYADGEASGEAPDFFFPSMLEDSTFFGVRVDGELVCAGGTHLVAPAESVAAIGNVYTRRDRRGRGFGAGVTSAIARDLLQRGIRTIALSVLANNTTAIRLYERLGFTVHCDFVDGFASNG